MIEVVDLGALGLGRGARLRRASADDLDAILAIKRALPMPDGRETESGGFLLGSEDDSYRGLLAVARVWLLEIEGAARGFTVTLDDPVLRASPIWARREAIAWQPEFDPQAWLARRVAYFDQLAVLPGARSRYLGAVLALRALGELFDERGHELVLTTTIVEPIINRAALPYLARVGAREVGRLDETYAEVGSIVSAIHAIEATRYREQLGQLRAALRPDRRALVDVGVGCHG